MVEVCCPALCKAVPGAAGRLAAAEDELQEDKLLTARSRETGGANDALDQRREARPHCPCD